MVLYEMLTGRRPFDQSASYSPMPAIVEAMAVERGKAAPSLRERRSDVPWSLESIARKCLAPNPADRYQHAEQVAEDLRRYLEDRPLRYAPELSQREQVAKFVRRHPRLTQAGALVSAAVLLLGTGAGILAATRAQLTTVKARAYEAEGAEARERKQAFVIGAERARILVNTSTGMAEQVKEGVSVCEQTLGLYDILRGDDWQQHPAWQRLEADDRQALAEDARELLLLLAWAKVFLADTGAPAEIKESLGLLERTGTMAWGRDFLANTAPAEIKEALGLLERAEAIPDLPASSALWHDRGVYLARLGDPDGAAAARAKADTFTPTSARDHYLLATAFARQQRFQDAIAQLKQALQVNPKHYWSLFQLGILYENVGDHMLAYGAHSACIPLWPEFAWGYYNRGVVLQQLRRNREALADFATSLKLDPKLVPAHLNRALLYLNSELRNPALALADLDAAAALGCDEATLHNQRGIALEMLGRHPEADAAFARALARAPDNVDLLLSQGFAVSERSAQRALSAFEKARKHEPRNTRALYGCAMLFQRQARDSLSALAYFNLALQVDPTFIAARRNRANVLAYRGESSLARQDIDWCVKADPSGETVYAAACVYALLAGKAADAEEPIFTERAIQLLEEAFKLDYGKDKAATDADLKHLHHHPEFRRLLRQLSETHAQQRGG
jgi:tetratricopeptide (TPR) repeat protein